MGYGGQVLHYSQSKVDCQNFLGLWLLTILNILYHLQTVMFKLSLKWKKKQNTKRETKSYHALVMAFLMAANEIKQLEDLTQANFDSQ